MSWDVNDGGEDAGVKVVHESFGKDEFIRLRSLVTDDMLKKATVAANHDPRNYDNPAYQVSLIAAMVLPDSHVLNRKTSKPLQWSEAGVRMLTPQQKQWIISQINERDGMAEDKENTIEIAGVAANFR